MPEKKAKTKAEEIKQRLECVLLCDKSLAHMQDMRASAVHELLALIGDVDLDAIRKKTCV